MIQDKIQLKKKISISYYLLVLLVYFFLFQVKCRQQNVKQNQFPKIIWMYWQDQSNLPLFCKICVQNIKNLTQQDGWQIKIINNQTFYDYIEDDQYFNFVIKNKKLSQFPANKADLIRLFLLYENGGIWIDISSILTQDFKWLNQLSKIDHVYNKPSNFTEISHPDVFLFANKDYGSNKFYKRYTSQNKIHFVYPSPGFQTWFIAAMPKSKLIYDWKKQFTQYFLKDYNFFYHKLDSQNIFARGSDLNVYMATSGALQSVIQTKQRQLDLNQNISFFFSKRIFAVDYYNLWFAWERSGPLIFLDFQSYISQQTFLISYSIQSLKQKQVFPQYFVKINGYFRIQLQNILQKVIPQKYSDLELKSFKTSQIQKNTSKFLVKNSIFDKFILSRLPVQDYNKIKFKSYQEFTKQDQSFFSQIYFQYLQWVSLKVVILLILIKISAVCLNPVQKQKSAAI